MGRTILPQRLSGASAASERARGVWIGDDFASWADLRDRAASLARRLASGSAYVVDPTAGLASFAALLAVAATPETALIWARPGALGGATEPVAPVIHVCPSAPPLPSGRPLYATLTSGTSGEPKVVFAHGECLELVALQYDVALYRSTFAPSAEPLTLATCLPLEYAAAFMMVIVPALFMAHDVVVFPPHRWDLLYRRAARGPVACVAVPALLAAACAGAATPVDMSGSAVITTAGYLSHARIEQARRRLPGARLMTSYGASETGVMTLDVAPDGAHFHVGRPIVGKPVWLEDVDPAGVGKIATTGPDCRDFYWGVDRPIRRADGAVAATDLGHFDGDGNLYLDGRIDGGVKLHGLTIYPRITERHLLTLPGVADVQVRVVTGDGVDRLEAVIVGSAADDAAREHCASLPEIYRPISFQCAPEGTQSYSSHGKL